MEAKFKDKTSGGNIFKKTGGGAIFFRRNHLRQFFKKKTIVEEQCIHKEHDQRYLSNKSI